MTMQVYLRKHFAIILLNKSTYNIVIPVYILYIRTSFLDEGKYICSLIDYQCYYFKYVSLYSTIFI